MKAQRALTPALTLALIVFGATACSKNSSPTKAVQTFYDSSRSKDIKAFKSVMTKEFLDLGEKRAQAEGKSLDELLTQILEAGADRMPKKMEIGKETIASDGKTATVEVKGDGPRWEKTHLIKEDDGWKVDLKQLADG